MKILQINKILLQIVNCYIKIIRDKNLCKITIHRLVFGLRTIAIFKRQSVLFKIKIFQQEFFHKLQPIHLNHMLQY